MKSLLIGKIKKEYNLKNPVFLKKLETRGKRSAFLIRNDKNKYVLKVVPNNKELITRLEFVSRIKKQGVNLPGIINTKSNKKYFLQSGNILFLSEFIDQKENRPSQYFFSKLGYTVGEFHKIKIKNSKIPELDIKGNNLSVYTIQKMSCISDTPPYNRRHDILLPNF